MSNPLVQGGKPDPETALCIELEVWCAEQGLPHDSADELSVRDDLTEAQRVWLRAFTGRWGMLFGEPEPLELRGAFHGHGTTRAVVQGGVEVGRLSSNRRTGGQYGKGWATDTTTYSFTPNGEGIVRGLRHVADAEGFDVALDRAMPPRVSAGAPARGPLLVRKALRWTEHYDTSPIDQDGVEVGKVESLSSIGTNRHGRRTSYTFTPNAEGVGRGLLKSGPEYFLDLTLMRAKPEGSTR